MTDSGLRRRGRVGAGPGPGRPGGPPRAGHAIDGAPTDAAAADPGARRGARRVVDPGDASLLAWSTG